MKKVILPILGALILLSIVLIYNTVSNKPIFSTGKTSDLALPNEAIQHMSMAIQLRTETPNDLFQFDTATFMKYRAFMEKSYPLIHQKLSRTIIDSFNYIYEWKGTDASLLPMVLMAHYDVVPVEESAVKLWHAAPYGGEVKDNYIWGRGVIDDKSSMISILEAAEAQLKAGFTPKQTIYLCFGADEESSGYGATAITKYFAKQNKRFDIVVDEGGEISTEDIKDIKQPIASIGVGEKGYVTLVLTAQKEGGHSSIPGKTSTIAILSKAINAITENQMPTKLTPAIKSYLERISAYKNNFIEKLALSNMWLFESRVMNAMTEERASNALVRTTLVPTVFNSGVRDNVIPTYATAYVNSRILPGETPDVVKKYVEKVINDTQIKISIYPNYQTMPSTSTDIKSPAFTRVENAIKSVVDSVIVAPVLMVGASDSRNYRTLSNGVINFTPITNGKGYHGIDEKIQIADFKNCFNFFTLLIQGSK
jgi:carboxypeptidase PM20D1